ncbi:helix-turn-helix domain-containing protein [Pilimelia terevasa]|uniref:helix-turn-helix domain-containing protein n=1 Tax=Pilimelia terevasa TaxID=53372 RepID=UPI003570C471
MARVATVAGRLFRLKLSVATVSVVLRRMGWSVQQPMLRAAERDEQAIADWARHQWPGTWRPARCRIRRNGLTRVAR